MKRRDRPVTILSVDWDYFLPCDVDRRYDWGHNENQPLFYEVIWPLRALDRGVYDTIQIDAARVNGFWDRVLAPNCPLSVFISDSHKDIAQAIRAWDKVRIVNFDAHHDCGYGQDRNGLNCGNWALKFRKSLRLVDYHVVYPAWRKNVPEHKPLSRVNRTSYGEWTQAPLSAPVVFLCRSSCWMPSWCDDQWLKLRAGLLARNPACVFEAPYITKARPFSLPVFREAEPCAT